VQQLTEGNWEVAALVGVDQEVGVVYFTANRDNPIGVDLYAVRLTGGEVRRVTSGLGVHRVSMNPGATAFADERSTLRSPGTVVIGSPGGDPERVIHEPSPVERSRWAEPELSVIVTEDGAQIRTLLLKPPGLERG
jgi:dipeptidyl-peptidase-4